MAIFFAPMEGLTDAIFRQVHHRFFGGVDGYYMPFFSPTTHRALTPREARELPMADSQPFRAVPQVLTKSAEDFLWMAAQCRDRGYDEINLNLGCPSGTVVAKGKGAGMLADPENLDRFLDAVFSAAPLPISIKTRLGMTEGGEFPALLAVFNRYPVKRLILHPRVRKAFYKGPVELCWFRYLVENCPHPLCYNGDLLGKADISRFFAAFPTVPDVMIGRGLIGEPGMLCPDGTRRETLEAYLDTLLEDYAAAFGSAKNAMFRMKEHWQYLLPRFEGSEKPGKRLRKATDLDTYRAAAREILRNLPMLPPGATPGPR